MAYQLLGIRQFESRDKNGAKKLISRDSFFDRRWRFEKIEEVFENPTGLLDRLGVPSDERYNLFYTVNYCTDEKRKFARAEVIAFDIDNINHERIDEYLPAVSGALGVGPADLVQVSSGGGLHFIIKLATPIEDPEFFDNYRLQYKKICKLIDIALEKKGLAGTPDTGIFDGARILRMPGTERIKQNKKTGEIEKGKFCKVLSGKLAPIDFDLERASGVARVKDSEQLSKLKTKNLKLTDGNAAFEACLFLKHCREVPAAISEPEWYAAASVIGRFKNGRQQFHEISRGHPKYSEKETDEKFDQALEASGPRTCRNINAHFGECSKCPHWEKITSPVTIYSKEVIPTEATGFYNIIEEDGKPPKFTPNYNDLLRAYRRDKNYVAAHWLRSVFEFDGKLFVEKSPLAVKAYAESVMDPKPLEKIRAEFLAKALANFDVAREWFETSIAGKINFENGIYDVALRSLTPHSPDIGFLWCLPYDFNPEATCPTWDKFIDEVLCGHAESIANFQEFMGYIVTGGVYKYHKALWLYGTGSNGKSTLINVLKAIVGQRNYSVASIKQILNDRFASADLYGKIANFCEETSPEDLSDSGPFKNMTGDGEILAQRKYGEPFSFMNRAKLVMTYNEIPKLKDLTYGMLRRPLIIELGAKFDEHTADVNIKNKLVAELSGIFNWALKGWERLESQGAFTPNKKSDEALGVVKAESDTVGQWVNDFVEFTAEGKGEHWATRALYEEYCKANPRFAVNATKFAHRLGAIPEMEARAQFIFVGEKKMRGYTRIKIHSRDAMRDKSSGFF